MRADMSAICTAKICKFRLALICPWDQLKCHVTIGFGETRQGVGSKYCRLLGCRQGVTMQMKGPGTAVGTTLDILGSDRMWVSAAAAAARVGSAKTLHRPTQSSGGNPQPYLTTVCLVSYAHIIMSASKLWRNLSIQNQLMSPMVNIIFWSSSTGIISLGIWIGFASGATLGQAYFRTISTHNT